MDSSFFERPILNSPYDEDAGVSTATQQYDPTPIINQLRSRVARDYLLVTGVAPASGFLKDLERC